MNDINYFSLLAPDGDYNYFELSSAVINDLSVDFIIGNVTAKKNEQQIIKKIITSMPVDENVISYRQEIYQDLKSAPETCKQLYEILDEMKFCISDKKCSIDNKSSILELIQYFKELDSYSSSIIKIKKCMENKAFKSAAMKKLSSYIEEIYQNSGFHALSEDMRKLGEDLSSIRSMTLGVNFNDSLYPEEVGIISMNEFYFNEQSVLEKFIRFHKNKNNNDTNLKAFTMLMHTTNKSNSESPLMNNLTNIVERLLPNITTPMKRILKQYTDISGRALTRLADELLFYIRFIELEYKLTAAGIPNCCAEISCDNTEFIDFYNLKLAICRLNGVIHHDIVCNDFQFKQEEEVCILTGPNRGGKTIFTQGIGLMFLFFQHGLFTPSSSAKIKICDGIYTHFPADENKTVALGRLGEEAARFSEICKKATSESLLLFNESFVTTSHTESIYIAKDALKYLCCLGARTCFNTHMFELVDIAEKFSLNNKSVNRTVSMVMGDGYSTHSYMVSYAKPNGTSYAHDIAYKFGITFEQLYKNID